MISFCSALIDAQSGKDTYTLFFGQSTFFISPLAISPFREDSNLGKSIFVIDVVTGEELLGDPEAIIIQIMKINIGTMMSDRHPIVSCLAFFCSVVGEVL